MKKIRFFSAAMAAAMLLSLLPVSAVAAEGPEHLAECGYVCTHVHSEECGYYVPTSETLPCDHGDDCGYVAEDVYGACDCAAEADDEGTLVHSDACASLMVVTAAAPCGHVDGDAKDTVTETPDACTHICGDDEWVCAEGCPTGASNELVALMSSEVIRNQVQVVLKDKDNKYAFNEYMDLQYDSNDPKGLQMAIEGNAGFATAMKKLVEDNPAYYISIVRDYTAYIYVYTALAGDVTATAENGTVSYKSGDADEAIPYTTPVANNTGLTFYFTPNEGYALAGAKMFQNDIALTPESDGSYSYTLGDNYLYNTLTLAATFVEKPVEVNELMLDIANGPVSVTKSGNNLLVVQGETRKTLTGGALTLTGTMDWGEQMPKTDLVTIGDGVKLALTTDNLTIVGYYSRKHVITIGKDAEIDWTLVDTTSLRASFANTIRIAGGAEVFLHGDTLNAVNDGVDCAVICVPQGAKLTIDGATVSVKGGGAGIGNDSNHGNPSIESWAGNIEIVGGAHVTAEGGNQSAAIGGGQYSNGGSIHIGGGSVVDATSGGNGPAAIGGGQRATGATGGKAGTIVIDGGATVIARGTGGASAIGRGLDADNNVIPDSTSSITIAKGTEITAYALGQDNYTGEHGKPYYFAIDAGIPNNGDASILNARFDKGALPKNRVIDKSDPNNPVSVPQFNNIIVMGGEKDIPFALPAESPITAFATTVSGAGDYMVANAAEGKTAERAQYLLEDGDSQFLFTVGEGMTTRDQLKFASYTITASAGENGSISDAGETAASPLGTKTYTFSPATGYVVDTVTVDSAPVSVTGNTYTFENVTANHTIAVTFKTAPAVPVDPPVGPGVTTYTVTVKYVDMAGKTIAPDYTARQDAGSSYNVSAQAAKTIAGYTKDHVDGAESGTVQGNVTVTVYYAAVTDNKPEEPGTEIPDEEPPRTDLPETEIPGEEVPTAPGPEGSQPEDGDTVIVDPAVPMGNLPQTGAVLYAERPLAIGVGALAISLLLAGMAIGLKKRKDEKNA